MSGRFIIARTALQAPVKAWRGTIAPSDLARTGIVAVSQSSIRQAGAVRGQAVGPGDRQFATQRPALGACVLLIKEFYSLAMRRRAKWSRRIAGSR